MTTTWITLARSRRQTWQVRRRYRRPPEGCPGPADREGGGLAVAGFDFTDPATDAYNYGEAVANELGEEAVEPYFEVLVGELFGLVPGLRERFSDSLLSELKEEIARRKDPKYAHATIALIETIEDEWRNTE